MPYTSETAKSAQLKGAESKRLNKLDLAKQSRRVIAKALLAGDTRVAMEVAREMGVLRSERKASSDPSLTDALTMLSQPAQTGAETQAAAKAPANENSSTVSHKIFSPDAQVDDNKEDNES